MSIKRIFIPILCLLMLIGLLVQPFALAAGAISGYDYSREGSYFNTDFTSADILELALGIELTDG